MPASFQRQAARATLLVSLTFPPSAASFRPFGWNTARAPTVSGQGGARWSGLRDAHNFPADFRATTLAGGRGPPGATASAAPAERRSCKTTSPADFPRSPSSATTFSYAPGPAHAELQHSRLARSRRAPRRARPSPGQTSLLNNCALTLTTQAASYTCATRAVSVQTGKSPRPTRGGARKATLSVRRRGEGRGRGAGAGAKRSSRIWLDRQERTIFF